jgi:hypothetical protein
MDQAAIVTRAKTAVDIVNDALRACYYSFGILFNGWKEKK